MISKYYTRMGPRVDLIFIPLRKTFVNPTKHPGPIYHAANVSEIGALSDSN